MEERGKNNRIYIVKNVGEKILKPYEKDNVYPGLINPPLIG